jgi:uncharacterized protein YjgD (DUF1641 family)
MMWMSIVIFLLVLSIISNVLLYRAGVMQLQKNEMYEKTIEEFYSNLTIVLHTIRAIDEKQMFESDDEVGSVFDQIVDTINELRPILYETKEAVEK